MKVVLSTPGKFHTFDLARELYAHGMLQAVFTGYPWFKLKNESIPKSMVRSFPWLQASYMAWPWKHHFSDAMLKDWENLIATTLAKHVAAHLPVCDLYMGMSGSSLEAGKKAHGRGAKYICDRGSAHIVVQDRLLREEHALWEVPFNGIDPRVIDREQAEYEEADAITVPSIFSRRSFIEMGVPQEKLRVLPYGVNLGRFSKVASPDPHRFDILFVGGMSLQKGIPYLLQAYLNLQHPGKSLTFAGAPSPDLISSMQRRQLWPTDAKVLGHVPQADLKHLMSRSHVMVLPSVQDGFGMVMAQAMASGCPVIASRNTGAEDLFEDGIEGFVVPIRDAGALSEKLQWMADHPADRDAMGQQALRKVRGLGGWQDYGQRAIGILQELAGHA